MKPKEVWKVHLNFKKYPNDHREFCVFAVSAGQAEKRAIACLEDFERKDGPRVLSAKFHCYVY